MIIYSFAELGSGVTESARGGEGFTGLYYYYYYIYLKNVHMKISRNLSQTADSVSSNNSSHFFEEMLAAFYALCTKVCGCCLRP